MVAKDKASEMYKVVHYLPVANLTNRF